MNKTDMKTAFIFPGQGSQIPSMLNMLDTKDPIVDQVFQACREVIKVEPMEIDSQLKLHSTVNVQLSLLIMEVISARKLLHYGIRPDFVAGHSVGAFSAAVIAGVITLPQALQLVLLRSTLMEQAYPKDYGMLGVVGLSLNRTRSLLDIFNQSGEKLFLSNINSADQQVLAGKTIDLQNFSQTLQAAGARKAQLLNVSVPSHCRLMDGVAAILKVKLGHFELAEPQIPYVSNLSGRLFRSGQKIGEDLWKGVAETVQWYDGTRLLYELGARTFIELEPSGVLSKLTHSTLDDVEVLAVSQGNAKDISWLWKGNNKNK